VRKVQNHHTNTFAKSPCRKLFTKKSTKFRRQVFLGFVLCYRVFGLSGVSEREEFKNTTKKRFTKKSRRKVSVDQKSKTDFSRGFLLRFWAFLGEENLCRSWRSGSSTNSRNQEPPGMASRGLDRQDAVAGYSTALHSTN
jgi:hypothetical protein